MIGGTFNRQISLAISVLLKHIKIKLSCLINPKFGGTSNQLMKTSLDKL